MTILHFLLFIVRLIVELSETQLEKMAAQKESIDARRFADAGRSVPVKTFKYDPTKTRKVAEKQ